MDDVPYCPDDVIDARGLLERGLTSHAVDRLCRDGRLHPLVRGWFATREPADAVDRHLLAAAALVRHFDGRAALSHHTRLLAAGIPTWRADLSTVHLTRVGDRGARRREGYRLHPTVPGLWMRAGTGAPAVPIAVACVQTGLLNGPMDALIGADAALRAGLVTQQTLERAVRLFDGRTSIGRVRAALAHADGRHESPGETRLAAVLRDLGVAATPQVLIRTTQGPKRVDALLDEHPVVLEFDGAVKYRTPGLDRDAAVPGLADNPLFAEKLREDAIRDERFEFVRVVWSQLGDPAGIHKRVVDAIARCTRRAA